MRLRKPRRDDLSLLVCAALAGAGALWPRAPLPDAAFGDGFGPRAVASGLATLLATPGLGGDMFGVWFGRVVVVLAVVATLWTASLGAGGMRSAALVRLAGWRSAAQLGAAALICTVFALGLAVPGRTLWLLALLPGLLALAQVPPLRGRCLATVALVFVALWGEAVAWMLAGAGFGQAGPGGVGVSAGAAPAQLWWVVRQAAWWGLVAELLAWLVAAACTVMRRAPGARCCGAMPGVLALGLALQVGYAVIFLPMLPQPQGVMGSDHSVVLTNLLAGDFWYLENGAFAIPWFSPGQCGGVPYFGDANATWLTLAQALSFGMTPLAALRTSVLVFASLGFIGAYALLRSSFRASVPAALLGGALFQFNGFYATRMLAGHFVFHPFMLLPLFCCALSPLPGRAVAAPEAVLRLGAAGLLLAAMINGGMVHGVPPSLLAAAIVELIWMRRFGAAAFPAWGLAIAIFLGAVLSAARLDAMAAFVGNFPRTGYLLPGFARLGTALATIFDSLFLRVPADVARRLDNVQWLVDRHEFEIGVTVVPLVLIGLGSVAGLRWRRLAVRWWAVAGALVLAALPLVLNLYTPWWNDVLKALPYFASSSNLVRWFCAYVLPAVVLGALGLDAVTPHAMRRGVLAAASVAALLGIVAVTDFDYYRDPGMASYDPAPVEAAWRLAQQSGHPPEIVAIAEASRLGVAAFAGINRVNAMAAGRSVLQCYQPMFGYRLEAFPAVKLRAGTVLQAGDGDLNIANPACMLFPAANRCTPGTLFHASQLKEAGQFTAWRGFAFAMPWWMHAAVWLNLAALVCVLAGMGWAGWRIAASRRPAG
jgi:hypothetical protein